MLYVYCDGACEPVNPGGIATWGYVIYVIDLKYGDRSRIREAYGVAGVGLTNNIAEYTAVIEALEYLIDTSRVDEDVTVYSDSQLLINQLNGVYNVWSRNIRPLYEHVISLLPSFKRIEFEWIPREMNREADSLSRRAYYEYLDRNPDILNKYREYMITPKQIRYIAYLCKKLDKPIPTNIDKYSKREASRLIDSLLKQARKLKKQ